MPLNKKIVLIGDPAVGKTSLIRRFVLNQFDDKYMATIGVNVSKKTIEIGSGKDWTVINLIIFDIMGQHDFKSVREKYIAGANGAVIVADLERVDTIDTIQNIWIPAINKVVGHVPMVFMGNKLDLVRGDTTAEYLLGMIAGTTTHPYVLCSAKTGEGVEKGFRIMAQLIVDPSKIEETETKTAIHSIDTLRIAADSIMRHFCDSHENPDKAIEICTTIFKQTGFSLENPKSDVLLKIINLLAEEESTIKDQKTVVRNRLERLRLLSLSKK